MDETTHYNFLTYQSCWGCSYVLWFYYGEELHVIRLLGISIRVFASLEDYGRWSPT